MIDRMPSNHKDGMPCNHIDDAVVHEIKRLESVGETIIEYLFVVSKIT